MEVLKSDGKRRNKGWMQYVFSTSICIRPLRKAKYMYSSKY